MTQVGHVLKGDGVKCQVPEYPQGRAGQELAVAKFVFSFVPHSASPEPWPGLTPGKDSPRPGYLKGGQPLMLFVSLTV